LRNLPKIELEAFITRLPSLKQEVLLLLGYWRPHNQFQEWLEQMLSSLLPTHEKQILFYADILEKVYILDLDKLLPLVLNCYSFTGRPARHQPEMFRALVVLIHCKERITSFVKRLKADPVLAVACGFEPGFTPGVGNFYDLLDRFWLGQEPAKVLRKPETKQDKKLKKGEKLPEKYPGLVAELVEKVLNGYSFPDSPERLLQKILTECAVKPSLNLGLCGDPKKLTFAGDGAPLETGASPYGKKICHCKEQGIYRCSCPRLFTGPTANWGWDSYHERWFYGHSLYSLTAADSFHDLPLLLSITQASRHDSGTFVAAYAKLRDLYPDLHFTAALLDSAHDAYDIYRLLLTDEIQPFIDLNKRGEKQTVLSPPTINDQGIPLCPAGLKMQYWGIHKKRNRLKWRCPLHKNLDCCPQSQPCSPSAYGRVVYTKPKDDLRLFTTTPRGSEAWKKTFAKRTSVERTLKRILVDYRIESARLRAEKRWFWFASLAAINQHLDAQVKAMGNSLLPKLGLMSKAA
jgi:hypothetical protein